MTLPFVNRKLEQSQLRSALVAEDAHLIVVYGRRRCGKSTLLQHLTQPGDVYFLADQSEPLLQIQSLASEIGRYLPEFDTAAYRSWSALLRTLNERVSGRLNLFLDEFPYLVRMAPELPSVIQHYLDTSGPKRLRVVLCGSSQRMMHGLVMDRSAPLYGRAREILKIEPLKVGWLPSALKLEGEEAIEAYAVWGGVPRYWELAAPMSTTDAIDRLVLDRNGILHEEPVRLLLDDMRSAVQPYSLLSLVGSGCHRLSEIAGRLGKPAGGLVRPLSQLIDLGYLRRELPWGESTRSTRKTLYKVADPFLAFHARFVQPNRSLLEIGKMDVVGKIVQASLCDHVAAVWEQLARESVPFLSIAGDEWRPASRWWGTGTDRKALEVDIVAESLDRRRILVGEAKWSTRSPDLEALRSALKQRASRLPFVRGREIVCALWLRNAPPRSRNVFVPKHVLSALR